MAQRRLFSPEIVSSDAFLDMPISTQALYFHLCMNADDDGFVNPKKIMRILGASEDDLKVLLSKRFVLPFQSGVIVIKHWLIHNTIRKDRYKPTVYLDERKTLFIKENKAYTEMADKGCQTGNQMAPQVKLSKGKVSKVNKKELAEISSPTPTEEAINFFSKGENYKKTVDWLKSKGISEKGIYHELDKFIIYWTERNKTGKKQRWEMEKTFEVKRRLATWLSRVKEFSGNTKVDTQAVDNFSTK